MKKLNYRCAALLLCMLPALCGCGAEPDSGAERTAEAQTQTTASAAETTAAATTTASHTVRTETTYQTTETAAAPAETSTASAITTETPPQTVQTVPTTAQTAPQDGVNALVNGVLVVNSGTDHPRALEVFTGNYDTGRLFAEYVSKWSDALGSGVHTWCMVAPSSEAVYQPAEISEANGSQLDHWNNIAANLRGVTGIPLVETMRAHKDEPIYSRSDYHWFPRGAYYAAKAFTNAAGLPSSELSAYEPVTREGYVGAFARVNEIEELSAHPEQFTYYKPDNLAAISCTYYDIAYQNPKAGPLLKETLPINASYQIFGGTDDIILEVNTNADTGRVLVIFKDSFGNALVPFMTHAFDKIVVCDFRYFDPDPIAFIQNEGATDLLFCMTTSNIMSQKKTQNLADMLGRHTS